MRNKIDWIRRLFGKLSNAKSAPSAKRGLLSIQQRQNEKNMNLDDFKNSRHDLIGPADKISNLRRYHYHVPANESRLERDYRLLRDYVNEFNHKYWTEQNLRFVEARRAFLEAHKKRMNIMLGGHIRDPSRPASSVDNDPSQSEPSTAELNEFYKRFLNENYYNHYEYNQKWIRYNFALLWPACKVFFYRLYKRVYNRKNKRLKI